MKLFFERGPYISGIYQFGYHLLQLRMKILLICLMLIGCSLSAAPYKTSLASKMTKLSAISYESQAIIESWSCQLCSDVPLVNVKVVQNDSNSVYGYVGYSLQLKSIVIAFRGSVDIANWILNLKTVRTSYDLCDGCSVHIGFNQGFNSVKDQVNAHINTLLALYRENSFALTGHSLGGALSVMAAAYLQSVHKSVNYLYTMGQPRVGNDKFAAFMTQFIPNTYRIVNYADQVPHIPQSALGFKHQGSEIWYQRGMSSYKICPSESKDCSNQLSIFQMTQADHKMNLYLQLKVENDLAFTVHNIRNRINEFLFTTFPNWFNQFDNLRHQSDSETITQQ